MEDIDQRDVLGDETYRHEWKSCQEGHFSYLQKPLHAFLSKKKYVHFAGTLYIIHIFYFLSPYTPPRATLAPTIESADLEVS